MTEPKWEDLDRDCLVSIFGRLGLESLLLDVPFVCKSWYKATRIPQSWRHLDFSKLQLHDSWYYDDFTSRLMDTYGIEGNFPITAFIKSVVKRSRKSATYIALPELPNRCMEEALLYVADECPALRTLVLPSNVLQGPQGPQFKIKNHMSKWTNLQFLKLQRCFDMKELLTQINIHCKNFEALAIERANIGRDEASAIVKFLPNIKVLDLRYASMKKKNLMTILKGCKQLELFDARYCIGFTEGDEEILRHASHIRSFKHEGSMNWYYYNYCVV
ncbi:F-box/LRR-repeat protein At3g48880-like [Actinidia eriantha]|uniref:F-box/LRR-repeat protein At3g48880-like n=1 Tax=Actinidia eriantha TaxID=165200 RepID=UPI002590C089|nr:F-box/LRR-repeat protein At3g48880-like [Actinidia eriantha]XP_057484095.1 F-box/LRR-repeat protein At3g48880-like [Actinidia eriantha]